MKWNKENIQKIVESFAIATGHNIINLTQHLDKSILPNASKELALWMDTINGQAGGWYHRVQHGHDYLMNIHEVYDKFGAEGVIKYPYELLKDFTTPHGVPMPGTEFLVNHKIIGAKSATEWLSCNVGDIFTGSIAFYSTYKLYKKSKNNNLKKNDIIWASIGLGIKIVSGVATTNPVLILSGITDVAILITSSEDAKKAFKEFLDWDLIIDLGISSAAAIAVGSGAAATTTAAVSILGVASTGTAISTLSGAAATNATLAAIGGGSLATGGLGIVGGVAILSVGGAAIGITAAVLTYKHLKKKKAA